MGAPRGTEKSPLATATHQTEELTKRTFIKWRRDLFGGSDMKYTKLYIRSEEQEWTLDWVGTWSLKHRDTSSRDPGVTQKRALGVTEGFPGLSTGEHGLSEISAHLVTSV